MTKTRVKQIEDQIKDLEAQVKEYYVNESAKQILQIEQEYLGKMYIKEIDGRKVYLKILSALSDTPGYRVSCIEFELPLAAKFRPRKEFIPFHRISNPFDYGFDNDLFIFTDCELIQNIDTYKPISAEEFNDGYQMLMDEIAWLMLQTYTIESEFGGEYAQKILEQEEEE